MCPAFWGLAHPRGEVDKRLLERKGVAKPRVTVQTSEEVVVLSLDIGTAPKRLRRQDGEDLEFQAESVC